MHRTSAAPASQVVVTSLRAVSLAPRRWLIVCNDPSVCSKNRDWREPIPHPTANDDIVSNSCPDMSLDCPIGVARHAVDQFRGKAAPQQHALCGYASLEAQGATWDVTGRSAHGPANTSQDAWIRRAYEVLRSGRHEQTSAVSDR
jgi:hypothetical protein